MSGSDNFKCDICGRDIPLQNRELHEVRCSRTPNTNPRGDASSAAQLIAPTTPTPTVVEKKVVEEEEEEEDDDDDDLQAALALSRQSSRIDDEAPRAQDTKEGIEDKDEFFAHVDINEAGVFPAYWHCQICTLINERGSEECVVCGNAKQTRVAPGHANMNTNVDLNESQHRNQAELGLISGSDSGSSNEISTNRAESWPRKRTIEVCLIRHAQSDENVKFYAFLNMIISAMHFRMPEVPVWQTLKDVWGLLGADGDSMLAALGDRQVRDMQMILRDANFWTRQFPADVVCYSPLKRARETLRGCLPDTHWVTEMGRSEVGFDSATSTFPPSATTPTNASTTQRKPPPFVCLPSLREASPAEHVPIHYLRGGFLDRIADFQDWIGKVAIGMGQLQGKTLAPVQRVVVCGHSQYFKIMLKQKVLFRNNDVQRVSLTVEYDRVTHVDSNDNGNSNDNDSETELRVVGLQWGEPVLMHRTQLAPQHPFDALTGNAAVTAATVDSTTRSQTAANSATAAIEVENDLVADGEDQLKQCRICQATSEEDPENAHTLIRPCRCIGSQMYVHLGCLNQWRATSEVASARCSVCKYEYRIRTHKFVAFLNSDAGVMLITVLVMLLSALMIGWCLQRVATSFLEWDLTAIIYDNIFSTSGDRSGAVGYQNINRFGKLTNSNWNLWWRYCKEARHQEYEDYFQFLEVNRAYLNLTERMHVSIYGYFRYFLTAPMAPLSEGGFIPTLFCNNCVSGASDALCVGLACMALVGVMHFIWEKINRIRVLQLAGGQLNQRDIFPLAITLMLVCAQATSVGGGRMGLAIGIIVAFTQAFLNMRFVGRNMATKMGEKIINYNEDMGIEGQRP